MWTYGPSLPKLRPDATLRIKATDLITERLQTQEAVKDESAEDDANLGNAAAGSRVIYHRWRTGNLRSSPRLAGTAAVIVRVFMGRPSCLSSEVLIQGGELVRGRNPPSW